MTHQKRQNHKKIRLLSEAEYTQNFSNSLLEIGDIGTVVFVYKQQKGYEVEFMTLTGETVAVISVLPSQVRTIRDREIAHIRAISPKISLDSK